MYYFYSFFGVKPYTEIRWYLPIAQCFYYTCITVRIRLVRPTVCLLIFCRVCRLKSILKNDFVLSDDLTWYCRLVECSIIGSGNSSQWRAGNWRTSSVQDKGQSCILWSKKDILVYLVLYFSKSKVVMFNIWSKLVVVHCLCFNCLFVDSIIRISCYTLLILQIADSETKHSSGNSSMKVMKSRNKDKTEKGSPLNCIFYLL